MGSAVPGIGARLPAAAAGSWLGDITGTTFLDFGCGTGRSARFLKALGARHGYAAGHDQDMIGQALSRKPRAT
jgi:predicted RNA methylase